MGQERLPQPGEEFSLGQWTLDAESRQAYLEAVGDGLPIYGDLDTTPPLALAAQALGRMLDVLSLPGGTIHASQEISCLEPALLGETVSCTAKLSRPMQRGEWRFITVDFTVTGDGKRELIRGKTTVLVPSVEGDESGNG